MKTIETLEEWNKLATRLSDNGWSIWQSQYYPEHPEGFHMKFSKSGKPDYEVVTHNAQVQDAMVKFKRKM